MRILATLQEADSGSVRLGDMDVLHEKQAVRRQLGYLPQEFGVYPRISAQGMLDHIAMLKGVDQKGERQELVEALLHRVNLWEHRKKALSGFSGGMKQRFGIGTFTTMTKYWTVADKNNAVRGYPGHGGCLFVGAGQRQCFAQTTAHYGTEADAGVYC